MNPSPRAPFVPTSMHSSSFHGMKGRNKKFDQGTHACFNCQKHLHHRCRPRLDNTLCTCSCSLAVASRARVADMMSQSPELTMEECAIRIAPRQKTERICGEVIPCVDRTKGNAYGDQQINTQQS